MFMVELLSRANIQEQDLYSGIPERARKEIV
jgi:hypothetical protein